MLYPRQDSLSFCHRVQMNATSIVIVSGIIGIKEDGFIIILDSQFVISNFIVNASSVIKVVGTR